MKGFRNSAFGYNASKSNPFTFSNTTALGAEAQPTKSNQVKLGDNNVTEVLTGGVIVHAPATMDNEISFIKSK